jgi:hypothetical protein
MGIEKIVEFGEADGDVLFFHIVCDMKLKIEHHSILQQDKNFGPNFENGITECRVD